MRHVLMMVALACSAGAGVILSKAVAQAPAPAPEASSPAALQTALPPGAGRDTTIRVCSGCHDPAIVAQQRLSRDGWTELVNTMAGRGAQATDAQLDEINTYLTASFPEKSAKP